jgi:hypothetical protein
MNGTGPEWAAFFYILKEGAARFDKISFNWVQVVGWQTNLQRKRER